MVEEWVVGILTTGEKTSAFSKKGPQCLIYWSYLFKYMNMYVNNGCICVI